MFLFFAAIAAILQKLLIYSVFLYGSNMAAVAANADFNRKLTYFSAKWYSGIRRCRGTVVRPKNVLPKKVPPFGDATTPHWWRDYLILVEPLPCTGNGVTR